MEISSEGDEDEFHEFQLLHQHSRFRRNAAEPEQCGPLKCGGESETIRFVQEPINSLF